MAIKVGQVIYDHDNKKKWVAVYCTACRGSGSQGENWLRFDCSYCEGNKVTWEEVQYDR